MRDLWTIDELNWWSAVL